MQHRWSPGANRSQAFRMFGLTWCESRPDDLPSRTKPATARIGQGRPSPSVDLVGGPWGAAAAPRERRSRLQTGAVLGGAREGGADAVGAGAAARGGAERADLAADAAGPGLRGDALVAGDAVVLV